MISDLKLFTFHYLYHNMRTFAFKCCANIQGQLEGTYSTRQWMTEKITLESLQFWWTQTELGLLWTYDTRQLTRDVFTGGWVGWDENVNMTFCVATWIWTFALNVSIFMSVNFIVTHQAKYYAFSRFQLKFKKPKKRRKIKKRETVKVSKKFNNCLVLIFWRQCLYKSGIFVLGGWFDTIGKCRNNRPWITVNIIKTCTAYTVVPCWLELA